MSEDSKEFPKYLYNKDGEAKLVKSLSEFDALGSDWKDSPAADFSKPKKKVKAKKDDDPVEVASE